MIRAQRDAVLFLMMYSSNFDDFQRIVLSIIFPVQVQLRIVYDGKLPPGVALWSALCAKLLLSSSPLARNVINSSCLDRVLVISDWLVSLGYQRVDWHKYKTLYS